MSAPGPTAIAIVPVRVGSRRLPRKALLAESGRALFLHTWERAHAADRVDTAWIATDSDEVEAAASAVDAAVVRTSPTPRTGSERCAEAAERLATTADVIVDVQGDWPEVAPADLDALVDCLRADPTLETATLAAPLTDPDRIADPNVVKVVRGLNGNALYFSRAPIPFAQSPTDHAPNALRHIGVYAFRREALARITTLPSSGLDEIESLEQLRFLENGMQMRVLDATGDPWGIESRTDYDAFLERQQRRSPP